MEDILLLVSMVYSLVGDKCYDSPAQEEQLKVRWSPLLFAFVVDFSRPKVFDTVDPKLEIINIYCNK